MSESPPKPSGSSFSSLPTITVLTNAADSSSVSTTGPEYNHEHGPEQDVLRLLSRTPQPYHHQNFELPHPAEHLDHSNTSTPKSTAHYHLPFAKDSSGLSSDSGTEADDEHFLKGLPAPKGRSHKGLRGRNELHSGTSTPLLSPAILEEQGHRVSSRASIHDCNVVNVTKYRVATDRSRKRKEAIRRVTECLVLGCLVFIWQTNDEVMHQVHHWWRELVSLYFSLALLCLLYPLRVLLWNWRHRSRRLGSAFPFRVPAAFDPAPLLYPHIIITLVSILIAPELETAVFPNLILAICTLPKALMPFSQNDLIFDPFQWTLSCLPSLMLGSRHQRYTGVILTAETATLLYPLHQSLAVALNFLTTTSLLTAELQLLTAGLINILLLASSPQMIILRTILWMGGLAIMVFCGHVIKWGVTLARVPKWRFRREVHPNSKGSWLRSRFPALVQATKELVRSDSEDDHEIDLYTDEERELTLKEKLKRFRAGVGPAPPGPPDLVLFPAQTDLPNIAPSKSSSKMLTKRNTIPQLPGSLKRAAYTPSGRRKRSASASVRAFFSLTHYQAALRKWLYAAYVQLSILAIILFPVREWIGKDALNGSEPVGWILGYMFGDIQSFRWHVMSMFLERWIKLPLRAEDDSNLCCSKGWVQHFRHSTLGEANTRLLISAYWLSVIAFGLVIVFQLSPFYEVDTRRKVFHFMMVAMLLPSTYIDPTFVSLALSVVLALFLLLDLLRASQLPPLSRPIANFLTPYVDGRDLRGPVVISHIFLLIGCAIPLWLSLASLPRSGEGSLNGWEVPTREVSMVSGVVCVGLGDAAASLIGRRWGHHKWIWGGGKSLEGSLAFAAAVFVGLAASSLWLRVGMWPASATANFPPLEAARNTGICASMASLTEAVLTGGNDNVIVPVVLWTCVKSLGV